MKNEESEKYELSKMYLKEFSFFDGECDITFNIVDINFEKKTINVAVTNRGKISVIEYDLYQDNNSDFFFKYGVTFDKIEVNDFETIRD